MKCGKCDKFPTSHIKISFMNYLSKTPNKTIQLGKKIASKLKGGEILCLYGELGAGKTTFTKGVVNYFLPKKRVLSPTYIIVRHYQIGRSPSIKNIYHVDLYRISEKTGLRGIGLDEFVKKPDSIVLIEWAEKLGKLAFDRRIDVRFEKIDENSRKIVINIK